MAQRHFRERALPSLLLVAGAAVWGVAVFLPMLTVWSMQPGEEPIALWDLLPFADVSVEDYDASGPGAWTYLVTFGPIASSIAFAALMMLGPADTFRSACVAAIAVSVAWLVGASFSLAWFSGLLSQMISGQPADFNAVRWLLLSGPTLCIAGGAIGLVGDRRRSAASLTGRMPAPQP
jgi:hypothetical protein